LSPKINEKSKKINRGIDILLQDTHRRLNKKEQQEENLLKKERL
jgi:hypothetical protein